MSKSKVPPLPPRRCWRIGRNGWPEPTKWYVRWLEDRAAERLKKTATIFAMLRKKGRIRYNTKAKP